MKVTMRSASAFALGLALLAGIEPASATGSHHGGQPLTPVVIFPAFHFTRLLVTVNHQTFDPACPSSGSFEDWYLNDHPSVTFSQVCQDEMMTLDIDPAPWKPVSTWFSARPGVKVTIKSFGKTESAPYYEPLYDFLEANGWERDQNIVVAGYDSRLTPDMDGFLPRTIALIEATYYANGRTPVHLVGHSNGPLYTQYLLTHTSQAWKNKFIHGFTPFAGNWPGQGLFYGVSFTGFNIVDFSFPKTAANALSSGRMYLSHPSSYMSSSDPDVFGNDEVVVENLINGKQYTPRDFRKLFQDAGLGVAGNIARTYIGFVRFRDRANFPNVDIYAEKGSGIVTAVGLKLQGLGVGQVFPSEDETKFINRDGDVNQEDITNDSIEVWQNMHCFRFSLIDNPGVNHFLLPSEPTVLNRLLANLQRTRSSCSH